MGPMLRVDGPGGKGLVRFRDTLAAMVVPEWKDRYLDYVGLTDEILEIQMQEAEVSTRLNVNFRGFRTRKRTSTMMPTSFDLKIDSLSALLLSE